jgi:phosphopantetheine--protein transferase-like protein
LAAAARQRIGIDIETLDAHQEKEWLRGMFDAEELALVVHPETRMLTALWCAREAAAKAAGTGLRGDSRAWRIIEVSPDAGLVRVAFDGNVREVALRFQETSVFAFCLER